MAKLGTTIIALGLYLVLCGVNLSINRPRIEKDLTKRARFALSVAFPENQPQPPIRQLSFSGRDALITLQGAEPELRKKVGKAVARVWGVRIARVVALPERAPAMSATDIAGKVVLRGELPKGPVQAKLMAAAGVVFGVANVRGDFKIADDIASPAYLDRLSSTLTLLSAVGDGGELQLRNRELILTGTVADENVKATIDGTAHELVPAELRFINQVAVVPRQTAAAPTPAPTTPAPTPPPTVAPVEHTDVVIPKEAIPAPPMPKKKKPHARKTANAELLAGQRLHFFFDSVRMVPESLPHVPEIVELLRKFPGKKIRIVGFADATGTARYNRRLSQRRARAVMKALIENGLSAEALVAEGHGATEFIGDNSTENGRALNRRVEFSIMAG